MMILKNVRADANCMVAASETEAFISEGRLDLSIPSAGGYLFIAQVKSRVTAPTGQEDQRTILLSSAKVDLTFPGSTLFSETELADLRMRGLTHFKQVFSAPLTPNGGLTDVSFTLVPPASIAALAAKVTAASPPSVQVVATFTIEGDMSGATVVSQVFTFPITMGSRVSTNVLGPCSTLSASTTVRTGYVCNLAQDGIVDCCTDATTGALACPAIAPAM